MKYIENELQQEIQNNFFEKFKLSKSQYNASNLVLNASVRIKFFKKYPQYRKICENILNIQPKFKKINYVLRCILLDIDLRICKTCGNEIRYNSKSNFCCVSCLQNDPIFKKKKAEAVHQFYERQRKLHPKPIDTRTKEQKHLDAVRKSNETLQRHRQDPMWLKAHNDLRHQRNLMRFGDIRGWMANPTTEQRKAFIERNRNKLWSTITSWNEYVIPLFEKNELETLRSPKIYKWRCVKCGNEFESKIYTTAHIHKKKFRYCPRCLNCYPKQGVISNEEIDLANSIRQKFNDVVDVYQQQSINKSLISPYEIDIVVKNRKTNKIFGIEYNGLFIHSYENGHRNGYHLNKTVLAENHNIPLIHIFSYEWLDNREKVLKMIEMYINEDYSLSLNQNILIVDRAKFNKAVLLAGYELLYEISPFKERHRKSKKRNEWYTIENCGYLVYEKSN